MFFTYLRSELFGRFKHTTVVSAGIAVAITLVVLVSSITAGIQSAQAKALESVYGVGTDVTVSQTGAAGGGKGGEKFDFGSDAGKTDGDTTKLEQSTLSVDPGSTVLASNALKKVSSTAHVASAVGVLQLSNSTFSGETPNQSSNSTTERQAPSGEGSDTQTQAPSGGPNGNGSSSFGLDRFTVDGVTEVTSAGPLSGVTVKSGKLFTKADASKNVAIVDSTYAKSESLKVGSTVSVAGTEFKVIGVVASSNSNSTTAANVYIPLKVAQKLSGEESVTTIYVKADSSKNVSSIQSALKKELSKATVNTEATLAASVNSSLNSVTKLIADFGTWLSYVALGVAFLLAVLFTISGVSRRTREFGTLKSIGWKNSRIARQVMGESLAQSLFGGVIGLALGTAGVFILNAISPVITNAPTVAEMSKGTSGPPSGGGMSAVSSAASSLNLHAILTPETIAVAIVAVIVGGVVAGLFGSLKANKLSPAEALRSI